MSPELCSILSLADTLLAPLKEGGATENTHITGLAGELFDIRRLQSARHAYEDLPP